MTDKLAIQSAHLHFDLMKIHAHAAYTHDARARIESINDWVGGNAPRFWLLEFCDEKGGKVGQLNVNSR